MQVLFELRRCQLCSLLEQGQQGEALAFARSQLTPLVSLPAFSFYLSIFLSFFLSFFLLLLSIIPSFRLFFHGCMALGGPLY